MPQEYARRCKYTAGPMLQQKQKDCPVLREIYDLLLSENTAYQNLPPQPLLQKTRYLEVDALLFRRH